MGNSISRYEMLRTVELTFRRRNPPKPRGVRIRVWEGDSAEEDDLTRLSINTARFVVCLSEAEDPRMADAQVLETLLSLLSLDADDQVTGTVIAELRTSDGQNVVNELDHTSDEDVLGVQSAHAVHKVIAFNALRPGVGEALIELISFEGNNFFFENLDPSWVGELISFEGNNFFFENVDTTLIGMTFGELQHHFPLCVLCGVHSSKAKGAMSTEVLIAPSALRKVQPGDRLLLIAMDRRAIEDAGAEGKSTGCLPFNERAVVASGSSPAAKNTGRRDSVQAATAVRVRDIKQQPWLRQTVLIIGWRSAREMADLVRVLLKMLLPGSEIHFLSAVDESVREAALREEMGFITALTDLAGGVSSVSIVHHTGSPLASGAIELLPLRIAAVAIVIADPGSLTLVEDKDLYVKGAARLRDARVFHITTLLRKAAPLMRIVPMYEDILTYRLLRRKDVFIESGTGVNAVLHRNSLETGLIAMQADDPT
eukprot:CAMPEP_0179911580 /NCGR_PEP_ID=MMETSP0982-20121206/46441_1 /TAXON_ID=483367 /ORGANISM="non described non described, Strain CCMP 2436" /LENGTH=483 /DNA_ID=CAMNT_0021813339 /DNA_START=645 /DNA_END=2093 /DNA_ORIENTATION=+